MFDSRIEECARCHAESNRRLCRLDWRIGESGCWILRHNRQIRLLNRRAKNLSLRI